MAPVEFIKKSNSNFYSTFWGILYVHTTYNINTKPFKRIYRNIIEDVIKFTLSKANIILAVNKNG